MKIAPSMLACDYVKMGEELRRVSEGGSDCFVPNISFGPGVIKALRPISKVPFDVHLMIDRPHRYLREFADAGADMITFHIEAEDKVEETIAAIAALGIRPGLSVKPATPIEKVFPYLDKLFLVLVMTVEPGFGGQTFMEDMLPKVRAVKEEAARRGLEIQVQVDGGINETTAPLCAAAGADICVAGTSVFRAPDAAQMIRRLQQY